MGKGGKGWSEGESIVLASLLCFSNVRANKAPFLVCSYGRETGGQFEKISPAKFFSLFSIYSYKWRHPVGTLINITYSKFGFTYILLI
jgi:hypothetical protein